MVGGGRRERAAGRESVRLWAARPSAPPSASRPDAAALGSAAAGLCGRPARRALPPRPRRRRPVGRSVSQSVNQSRSARRGSCGHSRRLSGRSAAPGEEAVAAAGGAGAAAAQPGAARGLSSCRGERPASPSGLAEGTGRARVCEALSPLPPPFSRRPAPPSGRGAGGRAWGGVAARAGGTSPGEAAGRWVGVGGAWAAPRAPGGRDGGRQ